MRAHRREAASASGMDFLILDDAHFAAASLSAFTPVVLLDAGDVVVSVTVREWGAWVCLWDSGVERRQLTRPGGGRDIDVAC